MKIRALLPILAILSVSASGAAVLSGEDINRDGKVDALTQASPTTTADGVTRNVAIKLSSKATPITATVASDSSNLNVYAANGTVIVDRSDRSSRDGAELDYSSYRWDGDGAICLHTRVTGSLPDQLAGELAPKDVEVTRYPPCTKLGSDELSSRAMPIGLANRQALAELSTIKNDAEIPEYLAFELARQVNASTVTSINDAGYYQERAGHLQSALILLSAVHARFPNRVVAQLNLADTYWELGDKAGACTLYASYLSGIRKGKAVPPRRAIDRSACPR